jgi:hypothetical protein
MSLGHAVAGLAWLAANAEGWRRFRSALQDPAGTQRNVLARCLSTNAGSEFGRSHGFDRLVTAADYQAAVPLSRYADYAQPIARIAEGAPSVLTRARVLALQGSGGTSRAKRIPYTAGLQRELRRALAPWLFDLYRRRPRLAWGAAYWSITPVAAMEAAPEAHSGQPRGSTPRRRFEEDSAYLGGAWKRLVDATLAVPAAVRFVSDMESFRYVTLRFLLARADLTLVSVWHPSFLTLLLDALPRHWESLLSDISTGRLNPPSPLSATVARQLAPHLRADPGRAVHLSRCPATEATRIWPRLGLVSCWGDAHASLQLAPLQRRLPGVEIQPKGLLATEAFVTLPFAGMHPLAVRSHFFEFLEEGDSTRLAHELEPGGAYSVVVTTGGGLYRYRLEDRVEVDGFVGRTPSLRFLGKQDHVSDLRGEKLAEAFVAAVLSRLFCDPDRIPRFALLAPEAAGDPPAYTLYLDTEREPAPELDARLETELRSNADYRHCVSLGQLGPARVRRVGRHALDRYLERCRAQGQRLGDVKPLCLSPFTDWADVLAAAPLDPIERGT